MHHHFRNRGSFGTRPDLGIRKQESRRLRPPAIAIVSGVIYLRGRAILLPVVESVAADSPAEAAGFQPEDRVVSIDGTRIDSFQEMQRIVQAANGVPLVFAVDRGGKTIELVATPRRQDVATSFGPTKLAVIGVQCKGTPENWHLQTYSLVDSIRLAGSESWFVVLRTRRANFVLALSGGKTDLPFLWRQRLHGRLFQRWGIVSVTVEPDIASKRQRRDAPACAIAVNKAKELRPKTKGKGLNLHAAPTANQKMPELVEKNHKA
jgi:PDZ domain